MTPNASNQNPVIEELADALQIAVLLAARLATGLRADAHDGDVLHAAIARAVSALQRLRPTGGVQ